MVKLLAYIGLLFISACFSAYTKNMQLTTLALGKQLAPDNPLLPTGLQDAITPPWQTRNNVVMFVLWGGVLVYGLAIFEWYWALVGFALFLFVLVPLCSVLLMPRPGSSHYVNLIWRSLGKRLEEYYATGNKARAEAAHLVLDRLNSLRDREPG